MGGNKYRGKRVAEINKKRAQNNTPDNIPNGTNTNIGKKSTGKTSTRKKLLTVLMIVFLSLATLVVSLGYYVRSLNTVFPNVYLDGVNVSGMTLPQVSNVITDMIESTEFGKVTVSVNYYKGDTLTITSDDAGFTFEADALNVNEMAQEVFAVGREGNFFQNKIEFMSSLFISTEIAFTDLDQSVALIFDEDVVRNIVEEHTRAYNNALVDDVLTINPDSIIIVKGTRLQYADADYVFDLVMSSLHTAVMEQEDLILDYSPKEYEGEDVDIDMLFDLINSEPISSVYDPQTLSATPSSEGATFDLEAARVKLNNAGERDIVTIPIIRLLPEISQEELNALLFRDVLAEISTNIAGSSNRYHNIVLASSFIHDRVYNPGEVFSFNRVVGRRTADRGFRMASGFLSGRVVDMLGGGICQVSSTLYVATLMANLEIVERRAHGMPISYLPLGQDATVAYAATIDYRFRNSSEFPIRIEMEIIGRTLTARIIGTRLEDYRIVLRTAVISTTPIETVVQESADVYSEEVYRAGAAGAVADVFKRFYDGDGNFLREELVGRTTYRMVTRIVLVPPPGGGGGYGGYGGYGGGYGGGNGE